MALLMLVIALGTLFGAAAYAPAPVFVAAVAFIGGWLVLFAARERIARARNR
ncbi:hypothetical protein NGB36_30345 [Streptomyces sp. RB6PN25]|uniref:Small hydrophobic membrane protein n=1 Tax=Streptomyces humicola TaxID=2953240 RepID=A0ABT1Q5U7_9ACTN|nr:hypothetical protein [Streptomyces humicola]MCQ4084758.1 hypothetical protein [Streptomyces humicola]